MKGTLIIAVLSIRSSYLDGSEKSVQAGDIPDTLQWWLGEEAWRIRTYAVDHDIHIHSVGSNRPDMLELAKANNLKQYGDVIASQHVLHFDDCSTPTEAARVTSQAGLANNIEMDLPHFVFWKPDTGSYRSQSTPE